MNTIIHDPENNFRIDDLHIFVSRDERGNEGVIAFSTEMGMMPMIAADKNRLKSLMPLAKTIATKTKKTVHLLRFTTRTEIEQIK